MSNADHDDLWAAYLSTIVEFVDPDGARWRLRTRTVNDPLGSTTPQFLGRDFVAWIVTAWNPRSELVSAPENAARHQALLADITAVGLSPLPAVGMSGDRTWVEESVLLVDAPREWVIELGEKYAQNAVFRWTPQDLQVVGLLIPGEGTRTWFCEPI